jgi:hypothetical protein
LCDPHPGAVIFIKEQLWTKIQILFVYFMADVADPTSRYELPVTHHDPGPINAEQKQIVKETTFFPHPGY